MTIPERFGALFEVMPEWRRSKRGVAARRTERQKFLISVGLHPLSMHLRKSLHLHWRASRAAVPATRLGHPTCGKCVFLERLDPSEPKSPDFKCWFGGGSRVTRGQLTNVRRWWPACENYEART